MISGKPVCRLTSVAGIPLIKLFRITPTGLNTSSDGEIRTFYDDIIAACEHVFREPLTTCFHAVQLNEWGSIDPDLTFRFAPLWQLDEAGKALVEKTEADTGALLIESGVISQEEERKRIAMKPGSAYAGLDIGDLPEPPAANEDDTPPATSGDPAKQAEPRKEMRSGV